MTSATVREFTEELEDATSPRPLEVPERISRQGMEETPDQCHPGDHEKGAPAPFPQNISEHEELKRCLPQGSVYIWAARLDGAPRRMR